MTEIISLESLAEKVPDGALVEYFRGVLLIVPTTFDGTLDRRRPAGMQTGQQARIHAGRRFAHTHRMAGAQPCRVAGVYTRPCLLRSSLLPALLLASCVCVLACVLAHAFVRARAAAHAHGRACCVRRCCYC